VNKKRVFLEIKDLHVGGHVDDKWVEFVHGVDLTVHRGEVVGLIGESGAGKSTIGLAAMGYTREGSTTSLLYPLSKNILPDYKT
jgi:peptide/nickel transport system ATP-binding protein